MKKKKKDRKSNFNYNKDCIIPPSEVFNKCCGKEKDRINEELQSEHKHEKRKKKNKDENSRKKKNIV